MRRRTDPGFGCSGAADVGAIADEAARRLSRDGIAGIYRLAAIGGHVSGILATTQAAGSILAIDGCSLDCARRTPEVAEITEFKHLRVTDLGMEEGSTRSRDSLDMHFLVCYNYCMIQAIDLKAAMT